MCMHVGYSVLREHLRVHACVCMSTCIVVQYMPHVHLKSFNEWPKSMRQKKPAELSDAESNVGKLKNYENKKSKIKKF